MYPKDLSESDTTIFPIAKLAHCSPVLIVVHHQHVIRYRDRNGGRLELGGSRTIAAAPVQRRTQDTLLTKSLHAGVAEKRSLPRLQYRKSAHVASPARTNCITAVP
jgi:hypothetical protein